ncbi:MAG: sigma-54 interaction domain-containing protein [Desulfitobacteriaceae bacterium]
MEITEDPSVSAIIGNSPQIVDLKAALVKVATRNTTILITGETGTGKEMFAQAIYQGSLRRFKPFIRVNCAAIPEALLESELFGYAEGTFTGGRKGGYIGKFAQADGGTIFLDEVAELTLPLQAKLLRFVQEREIQRLGESQPRRLNVRLIAATNGNLAQLVKYNKFRSDLYYRLNVVTLEIPPLRERREDILLLTKLYMKQLNSEFGYRVYRLSPVVNKLFLTYPWPGNVRELQNVLEVAFNLCDGEAELHIKHLPHYLRNWIKEQTDLEFSGLDLERSVSEEQAKTNVSGIEQELCQNFKVALVNDKFPPEEFRAWQEYLSWVGRRPLAEIMDGLEEEILRYLLKNEPNRSRIAEILGISRPALYKKIQKFSLHL